MDYIRRGAERGTANFGWLNSHHSFSFGSYYDPQHMGFGVLRVINDDTVAPGAGFDTHGHRDMEIISYILKGSIEHQDSMGHKHRIDAGEVQRMSAGHGVMHSEYNASQDDTLRFLQIWITPNQQGVEPGYEQKVIHQQDKLTELVSADGRNGSLRLHQDVILSRLQLDKGESLSLEAPQRSGYLHIINGTARVSQRGEQLTLNPADALGCHSVRPLTITATSHQPLTALWFDLPPVAL